VTSATDWEQHGIRIVRAGELDSNTPQTPGMTRAAITYARAEVLMPLVASEPAFAVLHGDPRFREIVRKLGL